MKAEKSRSRGAETEEQRGKGRENISNMENEDYAYKILKAILWKMNGSWEEILEFW